MNDSLTLSDLTEPRENTYFRVALAISILAWLLCVVTITPIIIAGIMGLFLWLGNGLLVAQLKADAVKIEGDQLPELAATFARVCEKLQIQTIPDLYVLQSGGILNAFATRHSGRNFVVVYSEILDTYGPDSAEIEFLLGHELGHIKRNHLLKHLFLAPGLLFPLLGSAYSRSCEASCDRHGFYAARQNQGALNAMLVLAGGRQAKSTMVPAPFASQYANERGFFVSWHELISGYPTTSQRVASLLALSEGRRLPRAGRHPLAYLFAFFTVGGRSTGGANVLVTVAVIGLLAAVAIPSFAKAREAAQTIACVNNMRMINTAKEQVALEHNLKAGDSVSEQDVSHYLNKRLSSLTCPKHGHYTINPAGQDPECSEHGSLSSALERRQRLPSQTSDRAR